MSRNKAVFGIGILCFTAGMYFGGALAEVKRPEFPAEEQETFGKENLYPGIF